jgi:hypothetical protein
MCDPRSHMSRVASTCRSVLVLSHRCRLRTDTVVCVDTVIALGIEQITES